MKNSLLQKIRKHIKKVYYYVPPCPLCGSPVTGRFVDEHRKAVKDWMVIECLKNGEIIKPMPETDERNCFCLECGAIWQADVETKYLNLDEIKVEKRKRHTIQMLADVLEVKEEEDKNAPGGVTGSFIKFVGKL